jgi:hypothetical protein
VLLFHLPVFSCDTLRPPRIISSQVALVNVPHNVSIDSSLDYFIPSLFPALQLLALLIDDIVAHIQINFEPSMPALPAIATWHKIDPNDDRFSSRVQAPPRVATTSTIPEAPSEAPQKEALNMSFYPAKHLATEFALMKKYNRRHLFFDNSYHVVHSI